MPETESLEVAARIADHLCDICHSHAGQSTWLATTQHEDQGTGAIRFTHGTVGPNVYGGTAGIGLFLAEVALRTGERRHAEVAISAAKHALIQCYGIGSRVRMGFYTGRVGVSYVGTRVGGLLDRPDLTAKANRILTRLARDDGNDVLLDVITGAAGSAPAVLALAKRHRNKPVIGLARRMGTGILRAAQRGRHGWSWGEDATGFGAARNLTGFAHGAAGFGWALLELHGMLGTPRFLEGALQAFRYESHWFRKDKDNWPDFREMASKTAAPCMTAWCHGSPGIGLSRLRAYQLLKKKRFRAETQAAVRSGLHSIRAAIERGDGDASPCHGFSGTAEFLLAAAATLKDDNTAQTTVEAALSLASRYGTKPESWPCGAKHGTNPSLMLGLAGIGYFFLRMADERVHSILLPGVEGLPAQPLSKRRKALRDSTTKG